MNARRSPRLGAWVKLPAPESVELLAQAGVDFVVLDAEHAALDVRTISTLIAVARGCGVSPFVRVAGTTARDVQVPLDAGAHGLFVPQIDDDRAAHAAVAAARFPPLGHRGASPSGRAGRWGLADVAEYVDTGNTGVLLVVAAESTGALDGIVGIGSVPGIDAVFIGPVDLAVSSGRTPHDPSLRAATHTALRHCREQGIRIGTTADDDPAGQLAQGYDFLVLGADTGMLRAGGRRLVDAARAGDPAVTP